MINSLHWNDNYTDKPRYMRIRLLDMVSYVLFIWVCFHRMNVFEMLYNLLDMRDQL